MKLKDIAKVQGGYAFKSDSFISGETPIIRIGNIVNNEVVIDNEITAPISTIGGRKEFLINKNDILIAMSGATVGKVGIYNYNYPSMLNQRVGNIKSDSKYQKYIYYLLQSPLFKKYVELSSFGCAQPNISGAQIENFEFKEIAIEEISKIVSELDKVTSLINIRKKEIENCNNLIKSQFVEMFGDIKHNVKGFEIIKLEDYTNMITYGLTVRPKYIECGIPLISATEIKTGDIDYKLAKKISLEDYESLSEKAKLSKGDMLFGKVGASIGYCAIVSNDEKIAITQNIARLILKDNVNQLWLKGFLTSDEIQDWCQREAKGNAMKDLQINTIRNMPIFKCDIELQNKFAQIVEQIDKQKFEFEKSLKKLEKLQASLMQEYFG